MKKSVFVLSMIVTAVLFGGCGSRQSDTAAQNTAEAAVSTVQENGNGTEERTDTAGTEQKDTAGSTGNYEGLEVNLGDQNSFFIIKLAEAYGFLDEEFAGEGITFHVDNFSNGTGLIEAFASKSEDFGVSGTLPIISAIANGSDIKILATSKWTQRGFAYVAAPGSGIEKLEDLKGKRIGNSVGTNTHLVELKLLHAVGLSSEDVTLENLSDNLTPLLSGDIDAAVLTGANLSKAVDAGATVIADCSYADFNVINSFVVRGEFAEQYPEVVSRLLKVMEKTTQYIYDHPDEAMEKFSELTQIEVTDAKFAWDSWDHGLSVDDEHFIKPIEESYEFLVDTGAVEDGLNITDFFDTSYYEAIPKD